MPVRDPSELDKALIGQGYTAVGVFDRRTDAERAIGEVRRLGWSDAAISAVMSEPGSIEAAAQSHRPAEHSQAAEGAAAGAAVGGIAGAALAGLAALALPGVGIILAAGPAIAALSGGALGASWGGVLGSLWGLNVPDEHAREYEASVRQGGIILSVRGKDRAEAEQLCQLFESAGARATNLYETKE